MIINHNVKGRCPMATQVTIQIDMAKAKELILGAGDKMFSVEFIKRTDNQKRAMVCRLGVKKALKGGQKAYEDHHHALITVYSIQDEGYRSIPLDRLISLKVGGKSYKLHPELEEAWEKNNAAKV